MNTTTLRPHAAFGSEVSRNSGTAKHALRLAARDFVAGLLSITKSGLLLQQANRPRLRRF
ncbi:MAG TPA: hypothetical protein VFI62_10335 [Burkholderiales bacterium]|nr:hypothetical protein [Burkholderiales bacterium]